MKNNKNRMREREKSNSELRKMEPKDNADVIMCAVDSNNS